MYEITGSAFECEAIARLLRGPRAAPVFISYAPGNSTLYKLCIIPCRAAHVLRPTHNLTAGSYLVVWMNHAHFLLDVKDGEPITPQTISRASAITVTDAQALAQFFSRIFSVVLSDAPEYPPEWSPGDVRPL